MRISDWSSDVCSSDLSCNVLNIGLSGKRPSASDTSRAPHVCPAARRQTGCGRAPRRDRAEKRYCDHMACRISGRGACPDKRSEEHTSELQSLMRISYAVFCLKKKKKKTQ